MADGGVEPGGAQALHVRGVGTVAAADRRPEPRADQRQAAHPGAADPDEVEAARAPVALRRRAHPAAPAAANTSSAIRRAASGIARDLEATVISAIRSSSPIVAAT